MPNTLSVASGKPAVLDPPHAKPDRRGGRREGSGRPPVDPQSLALWEERQRQRRNAAGLPPRVPTSPLVPTEAKARRGGHRPNSGRKKGDRARASETAQELVARHVQELATLVARHRRELRRFKARECKAAPTITQEGAAFLADERRAVARRRSGAPGGTC